MTASIAIQCLDFSGRCCQQLLFTVIFEDEMTVLRQRWRAFVLARRGANERHDQASPLFSLYSVVRSREMFLLENEDLQQAKSSRLIVALRLSWAKQVQYGCILPHARDALADSANDRPHRSFTAKRMRDIAKLSIALEYTAIASSGFGNCE